MKTKLFSTVAFLLAALACLAQEQISAPKELGKVVAEVWQTATIGDQRAGYVQFTVHEIEANDRKYLRGSRKLSLSLQRFGQPVRIEAITGTDETTDGTVVQTFMRQGLGQNVELSVRGVVKDKQLHVVADGKMKFDKMIPWDASVLGLWSESQLLTKTKPEPGTEFDYVIYEPNFNAIVKVHAKAEEIEEVAIAGQKPRLLRVKTDPAQLGGFTIPGSITWYDAKYQPVRSETIMPGLGRFVFENTTRAEALKPCLGPDIGLRQSLTLKNSLGDPHGGSEVVYRIIVKDDKDPMTVIDQDARQSLKSVDKKSIELTIRPIRTPPAEASGAKEPGKEFLESNNFINSDDERVKAFATEAVQTETDPWKKAQLIERWVRQHMKAVTFSEAMAPAGEVAKTLRGDCTEFAMLTAAMARAVRIPSRPAVGLVYVESQRGEPPMLAFHMWTEVWVRGQWLGLDATLGRGSIGTGHIKITDHSWHEVVTMTPLLPVMRFMMSQPTIEIISEAKKPTSNVGLPLQTP